jgi:hypothetical protein
MPYSNSQRGKHLFSITVTLLMAAGINSLPGTAAGAPLPPAQLFFHSGTLRPHIFGNYPLYKGDTALLDSRERTAARSPGFIRREKNGDLVIAIPDVARERYSIRFFDDDKNFLFEIRQIRDPMLILEKYNFQHTGVFQYELYRESALVERSSFLVRKD